ncbi:hypothetical protein [Hydrogenimonas urashimensis]|uniref:hypothetical protein n=1 Tax=Hydrogenimonas urashimensis TaxID=2740515 RepID=UPI0019165356|nr:hypothetical protein [Hydrogenimonas urashimensis]
MKIKKMELARRLNLRYATLLEWEKKRPEVYRRLVLSYEYEKVIEEISQRLADTQSLIETVRKEKS